MLHVHGGASDRQVMGTPDQVDLGMVRLYVEDVRSSRSEAAERMASALASVETG